MAADRKQVMFSTLFIFFCHIIITVYGRKTRDMIYVDIKQFAPCIRRFNATHEIGCTSSMNGNTGVVHYINDTSELDYVLNEGPHKPYIPIMTPETFNLRNVELLLASKKVNGIIVAHSNVSQSLYENVEFSPDKSCPNDNYGIYTEDNSSSQYAHCSDVTWNPDGNSLSYMNLDVPVFALLNQKEVDFLIDSTVKFNHKVNGTIRDYPLCAVELNNFMFGAVDTPTCIWRSQRITGFEMIYICDPLGGYNVWSVLTPTNSKKPLEDNSVVLAAAQLDSASLFYEVLPRAGADNAVTSFVTLLAAAQALGQLPNATKYDMKNIMFAFFNGESYDYIGSSRMVYDMQRDQFPSKLYDTTKKKYQNKEQPALINLDHISHYVELRQMGLTGPGNTMYAHTDPVSQEDAATKTATDAIFTNLQMGATGIDVAVSRPTNPNQSLPPASFQRFLRENRTIPGIVLTDHDREYTNRYYNSRFDVPSYLDPDYEDVNETTITPLARSIADVSTAVARALYKLARPNNSADFENVKADLDIVNSMLYCFLKTPNCSLFKSVGSPDEAEGLSAMPQPLSTYVGVYTDWGSPSQLNAIVRRLLAYFTGETTPADNDKDCSKRKDSDNEIFLYSYIQGFNATSSGGQCIKSIAQTSIALSPAFDKNTKESWSSTEYSTWTESRWESYSARIFLKPDREQESIIFSLGMIVLIASLSLSYFFNAKSAVLFAPNRTSY